MADKYNIVYPTKMTVDSKLSTSTKNNSSRLSLFLNHRIFNRPRKSDFGHELGLIEQDTENNQQLVQVILDARKAIDKYMSNYLRVDSLSMYRSDKDRLGEINLEYTNL